MIAELDEAVLRGKRAMKRREHTADPVCSLYGQTRLPGELRPSDRDGGIADTIAGRRAASATTTIYTPSRGRNPAGGQWQTQAIQHLHLAAPHGPSAGAEEQYVADTRQAEVTLRKHV